MAETTSKSLLENIKNRQYDEVLTKVVLRYEAMLRAFLFRKGKGELSEADLDEVLQDTWTRFFKALDGFQHAGHQQALRGFLRGIALNRLRESWREQGTRKRTQASAEAMGRLEDSESEISRQLDGLELLVWLESGCEKLKGEVTSNVYQAFERLCRYQPPQSIKQVAKDLGMTEANVRKAKSRCLNRLRGILPFLPGASSFL